jgi:hypothetical protein
MYSLALIISVLSEKKAFEHFPIGSNVNLWTFHISSFFSETTGPIGTKLSRNVPWMVLYKVTVFRSSRIFNMAAKANNTTDDRQQTTDDGRQVMAIVHLDLWSRWTNKRVIFCSQLFLLLDILRTRFCLYCNRIVKTQNSFWFLHLV